MSDQASHPPAPVRRRRRWWRWLLLLLLLLIPLVLLLPYAVALGPVRAWVERTASEQLGAECRIDGLSFSWLHGISVTGLEVGNPPGFADERPSLRARDLTIDLVRSASLGVHVRVDGLELFVEQAADGRTNLQQLGGAASAPPPPSPGESPSPAPGAAARMSIDVDVQHGRVEVRREGQLLEVATNVQCTIARAHGSPRTHVAVGADLQGGRTRLLVDHEQIDGSLHGELSTPGLDLARWQPLLQTFAPDRVTTLAGKVRGELEVDYRADGSLAVGGTMTVDAPRLGGPLVGGLVLGGETWRLSPGLTLGPRGGAQTLDVQAAVVDLGWLQVRGVPRPEVAAAAAPLTLHCELDLAALAQFDPTGDVLPTSLRGSGARLAGDVTVPTTDLPVDALGWAKAIVAALALEVPRFDVAGFAFRNVRVVADLRDGGCNLTTGDSTQLDGGPLSLAVRVDLTDLDTLPTTLGLGWQGGSVHGGTTKVLRYAMPLLAGLDGVTSGLTGDCDLDLHFAGPGLRVGDQTWLAWLDAWSGRGSLGLRDAAFVPTAALQGLLTPLGPLSQGAQALGDGGRLRIDSFVAPFEFAAGAVRTTAAEWLSKGQRIGLAGSVRLDGALDYEVDLTALLRGHRDGERVLQLLSGGLPPATIGGSLDAPKLALPQLEGVLRRLLEGQGRQQVEGLLKRALEDLLPKK